MRRCNFSTGMAVDMGFVVYGRCMQPWYKIMGLSNFNALYKTISIKRNYRRLKLGAGTPRKLIKKAIRRLICLPKEVLVFQEGRVVSEKWVLHILTNFDSFPKNSWQWPIRKRARNRLEKLFILVFPENFYLDYFFKTTKFQKDLQ